MSRGRYARAFRLLFVVNDYSFFLSHRLPVALAAVDAGYEVHVAAAGTQSHEDHCGFTLHELPPMRRTLQPLREIVLLHHLIRLYRRTRPTVVHHVTLKPVLYGTLAARLSGVPSVINAISGLGYMFTAEGLLSDVRRACFVAAFRLAATHPRMCMIFQNRDDEALFHTLRLARGSEVVLIPGSGVDLDTFRPHAEPAPPPVVVLAARMLLDKGVAEFVQAAAIVQAARPHARFLLAGATDPGNPTAISVEQLNAWSRTGTVEWWGDLQDVSTVMQHCHIVCLPSYREGIPKVLLEAAASGRAIVTTDVPGCRDVVRHGVNGLLVPPRDARTLAQAIITLIDDPELRSEMGRRGRRIAEDEYGVERVVAATMDIYRHLTRSG